MESHKFTMTPGDLNMFTSNQLIPEKHKPYPNRTSIFFPDDIARLCVSYWNEEQIRTVFQRSPILLKIKSYKLRDDKIIEKTTLHAAIVLRSYGTNKNRKHYSKSDQIFDSFVFLINPLNYNERTLRLVFLDKQGTLFATKKTHPFIDYTILTTSSISDLKGQLLDIKYDFGLSIENIEPNISNTDISTMKQSWELCSCDDESYRSMLPQKCPICLEEFTDKYSVYWGCSNITHRICIDCTLNQILTKINSKDKDRYPKVDIIKDDLMDVDNVKNTTRSDIPESLLWINKHAHLACPQCNNCNNNLDHIVAGWGTEIFKIPKKSLIRKNTAIAKAGGLILPHKLSK